MLKTSLLLSVLLTACAVDDTNSTSQAGTVCEPDCDCPPEQEGPSCVVKGETVFLDEAPANVDDNDRKVTYCHATSSATNPFVLITTSVHACDAHVAHVHLEKGGHLDVFGTDGCED